MRYEATGEGDKEHPLERLTQQSGEAWLQEVPLDENNLREILKALYRMVR